jgi:hypothetical protein
MGRDAEMDMAREHDAGVSQGHVNITCVDAVIDCARFAADSTNQTAVLGLRREKVIVSLDIDKLLSCFDPN